MKERDYLFDNYKAFLIVLVVVGHFIEVASDDNVVMETTKWIIFSFHMPAFVFISGYFSKKTQGIYKLLQQLVVPYLVFEILYYILYTYILNRDTELAFLYPKFSLWYLLAMFMWKMITPLFRRLPGYLWIAFVLGLFVGASSLDDNYLTLPRMFTFYPFFLLGMDLDRNRIDLLRARIRRMWAFGIFLAINAFLAWVAVSDRISIKIFYGRYDYEYLGLSVPMGIALRAACYHDSGSEKQSFCPGAKDHGDLSVSWIDFCSLPARRNLVSEFGGDCGGCYFGGGIHRNHLASLPTTIRSIYGLGNAYPDAAAAKNR